MYFNSSEVDQGYKSRPTESTTKLDPTCWFISHQRLGLQVGALSAFRMKLSLVRGNLIPLLTKFDLEKVAILENRCCPTLEDHTYRLVHSKHYQKCIRGSTELLYTHVM